MSVFELETVSRAAENVVYGSGADRGAFDEATARVLGEVYLEEQSAAGVPLSIAQGCLRAAFDTLTQGRVFIDTIFLDNQPDLDSAQTQYFTDEFRQIGLRGVSEGHTGLVHAHWMLGNIIIETFGAKDE